jgi:hypothetical protein
MKTSPKKLTLGLCEGRHDIPVDGYIYHDIKDPMDFDELKNVAFESLWRYGHSDVELTLYVTGLTPALISVLNQCGVLEIDVTLMHFDKSSGAYKPQKVYAKKLPWL